MLRSTRIIIAIFCTGLSVLITPKAYAQTCNSTFAPCETQWNGATSGHPTALYAQTANGTAVYGYDSYGGVALEGYAYSGTSGGTGVQGVENSPYSNGYGVYGQSSYGYGVYGTAVGSTGDGVHGYVNNTWSAVAGQNRGSGPGVYAVSSSGYGVVA